MKDDTDGICDNCCAPKAIGLAACKYCGKPFVGDLSRAVPCPHCRALCDWGVLNCARCQAPVVVACVFCNSVSPHHLAACLRCKEPFQGAAERLAARKAETDRQQTLETVATIGGVAATVLGVVATGRARSGGRAARRLRRGLGKLLDDD
jgi:hypothetical protein